MAANPNVGSTGHDKVYVVCENMCLEEGMTKEQITQALAGKSNTDHNHDTVYSKLNHNHDSVYSKLNHTHDDRYYLKGNVAVLTGSFTLPANQASVAHYIPFPSGFTKANSVLVAFCWMNAASQSTGGGNFYSNNQYVVDSIVYPQVYFGNIMDSSHFNDIYINFVPDGGSSSSARTFNYRLVLMKI